MASRIITFMVVITLNVGDTMLPLYLEQTQQRR